MQAANTRTGTKRSLSHTAAGETSVHHIGCEGRGDGGNDETFIEVKAKRRRRGNRQQRKPKQPTAESLQHMDEIIETVANQSQDSIGDLSFSDGGSIEGTPTVNVENEINRLKKLIQSLQHQVEFLMSFVGISQSQPVNNNPSATYNPGETSSSVNSYAAAAAVGVKKTTGSCTQCYINGRLFRSPCT